MAEERTVISLDTLHMIIFKEMYKERPNYFVIYGKTYREAFMIWEDSRGWRTFTAKQIHLEVDRIYKRFKKETTIEEIDSVAREYIESNLWLLDMNNNQRESIPVRTKTE